MIETHINSIKKQQNGSMNNYKSIPVQYKSMWGFAFKNGKPPWRTGLLAYICSNDNNLPTYKTQKSKIEVRYR